MYSSAVDVSLAHRLNPRNLDYLEADTLRMRSWARREIASMHPADVWRLVLPQEARLLMGMGGCTSE
eukprot:scaffold77691_cov30-Tisochrysis_lutea.AAC.7